MGKRKSNKGLAKEACDACGVTPTSDMRVQAEHIAMYAIRQAKTDAFDMAAEEMDRRSMQGRGMEASACYRNAAAAIRKMKDAP